MKNGLRRLRSISWQAGVSGSPAQASSVDSTLISRPPTASFSLFHSPGLGQSESPGRTRRLVGPVWMPAGFADEGEGSPAERSELVATSLSSVLRSILGAPFGMILLRDSPPDLTSVRSRSVS